jgi:Uma2 family endonuclease
MAEQTKTRLTAAAYFQLPEYQQHDLIQLIHGEVVIDMPPNLLHQQIVVALIVFLNTLVTEQGGMLYTAPAEVKLADDMVVEPDVFYLKPESLSKREPQRVVGAPDLVVEVLSPSTAKRDRAVKYRAYEQHGVGEYWIVDPLHSTVEVWTNSAQTFTRQGAYIHGDTFPCTTLGATVTVAEFLPAVGEE